MSKSRDATAPLKILAAQVKDSGGTQYRAAHRLTAHQRWSQWTVALVSVALVLQAIWEPLGLKIMVEEEFIDATQVFFAVLILAYSLLLSAENFPVRADHMRGTYYELERLFRVEITPLLASNAGVAPPRYIEIARQYVNLMTHAEPAAPIDVRMLEIRKPNDYSWRQHLFTKARYYFEFSHYLAIMVAAGLLMYVSLCFPVICEPLFAPYSTD